MSAYMDKTYPSLRVAFKGVKANIPITVVVKPKYESGTSDETDIRSQQTLDSLKGAWTGIEPILKANNVTIVETRPSDKVPFERIVRATKSGVEALAKSPHVKFIELAAR